MKKYSKVFVSLVILLVIVLFGIFVKKITGNLRQERILTNEINTIVSNADTVGTKAFEERLKTTVSTGDYAVVETTIKQYLSDFNNAVKQVGEFAENDKLVNVLSIDNLKKDRPDFKDSTKILNDATNQLDELSKTFSDAFTEESVNAYIKDKNLDEYYTNLYHKLMFGTDTEESLNKDKEELLQSLDKIKTVIKNEQEVINFLVKNKKSWTIQNNAVTFSSQSLVNEYNKLIKKLQ